MGAPNARADEISWGQIEPPWFNDKPVLLVGTGPSLQGFDFKSLRGLGYVIAVKQSWHELPFADAVFGLDMQWVKRERDELVALAQRTPLYISLPKTKPPQLPQHPNVPGAIFLDRISRCQTMSEDLRVIESQAHSGGGAVNFAYLKMRPPCDRPQKLLVLYGFDYTGEHYCPDRYKHNPPGTNQRYMRNWSHTHNNMRGQLAAAGIEVLNASPQSLIPSYPKVTHEQAHERLVRLRAQRECSVRGGEG